MSGAGIEPARPEGRPILSAPNAGRASEPRSQHPAPSSVIPRHPAPPLSHSLAQSAHRAPPHPPAHRPAAWARHDPDSAPSREQREAIKQRHATLRRVQHVPLRLSGPETARLLALLPLAKRQVARLLHVDEATLRKWTRRGVQHHPTIILLWTLAYVPSALDAIVDSFAAHPGGDAPWPHFPTLPDR